MVGFCGALNFDKKQISFSLLKKMCGLHGVGCAFINHEFGILCDGTGDFDICALQPVTVSYNNALYTAAIVVPADIKGMEGNTAQAVLEGYFEEGEEYIRRLRFPYALALYDSRCGELLLAKGDMGDKPLFYTLRDGTLYFASSLRPLIRLYGGCVRVNKSALLEYMAKEYSSIPSELFCDIRYVRPSHSLICSRFGHTDVPNYDVCYSCEDDEKAILGELPEYSKKTDMRKILTDALFAFDYPQFDCFMPAVLNYVQDARKSGVSAVNIQDPLLEECEEYSRERAERIGGLWGVDVYTSEAVGACVSSRELKFMEKQIDEILEEYLQNTSCVLSRLVDDRFLQDIRDEKSIKMRIRRKGMLCQTAMWFECFNLVLT